VTDLGSSPRHEKPTIPAPASSDEARLKRKLDRDRQRKLENEAAEPIVLAWMERERNQSRES